MYELPVTQSLENAPVVIAPDGSTVRPLCQLSGLGSFAHFQLEPGEVTKAVSHATVQEIWYIIGGAGRMWRHQQGHEPTIENLRPGICLTIPLGTTFQFRADSPDEPLQVVAVTMPPWPAGGEEEARPEQGCWTPVLSRRPRSGSGPQ
jgi:mannose-6-phosphate isomerase-like protein (cupin superfamily)